MRDRIAAPAGGRVPTSPRASSLRRAGPEMARRRLCFAFRCRAAGPDPNPQKRLAEASINCALAGLPFKPRSPLGTSVMCGSCGESRPPFRAHTNSFSAGRRGTVSFRNARQLGICKPRAELPRRHPAFISSHLIQPVGDQSLKLRAARELGPESAATEENSGPPDNIVPN